MGEKIVIGPINKGLNTSRTPFVIDNDSFPVLQNALQWRGRVKRKRGTSFLGRLTRFFNSTISSYSPTNNTIVLGAGGSGNLLTSFATLQTNSSLVLGSITINDSTNGLIYVDDSKGNLVIGITVLGSVNYVTGAFLITGRAGDTVSAKFLYYPSLPVMGLKDLTLDPTQFPDTMAFDDVYSYQISTASPYPIRDVSFYKNPSTGTYPGYIQKTNSTPVTWNGNDYQQFWSTNYQGAFWATNGLPVPFVSTNIGMQFKPIITVTVTAGGPPAIVTLQITGHGLVVGDFLFINEVSTTTGINFQTGYVIAVIDANNVSVEFPNATIATNGSGGIAQYLTNRSDVTKDCIRFYDGDPTDGSSTNPVLTPGHGWVNFCPPISQSNFSIGNLPAAQYYLVNCRMIIPFKDRILFLGVVVQNSGGGIFYIQDNIVYSQNGTSFYTCSYTDNPIIPNRDNPTSPLNIFNPILVPNNQTATSPAYFSDVFGFGGFVNAGLDQPITTASFNEDVIIIGFSTTQTRLVYSGSDDVPFHFYYINSEYGSASTFSAINFDKGVITKGSRGFVITSQTNCSRIDLDIPDQVFEINLTQNGNERLCASRDFINEWIYFTYPENNDSFKFPNQTLMWNYRDNSWSILYESYTTYGLFRRQTGFIWSTVGNVYPTWNAWNEPWNAGDSTLLQPEVIAGNQQGFILARDEGTGEGTSLYIQAVDGVTNIVTSPDHNLVDGDYIVISGVLGTVGQFLNGRIFSVFNITQNTFELNPETGSGTYLGGGLITKIYVPFIQTKQFPTSWGMSKKTRLGVQQYLLTTTSNAQITLLIYLSQNNSSPYNDGPIVPAIGSVNNSLIYSTILYTCPESTNLGLTPSNINLQMVTAVQQQQIWHRINTSLIGDTVQLGFTLSDTQVRDLETFSTTFAITNITLAYPCVITTAAFFQIGQMVIIQDVVGTTELNGNVYQVIDSNSTTVTINVDSSAFTAYVSGGTITQTAAINGFAEIEIHGIILEVSPSQILA